MDKLEARSWKLDGKIKILLAFIFIMLTTYNLPLTTSYAASEIAGVERLFLEGRYERVIDESGKLIDAHSRQRDELYYLRGLSQLKTDRFREARQSFEDLISKYPSSKRAFDAHVGIGDSYFLEGRYDEAAKNYNQTIADFPNDKNLSPVYRKIADCDKRTGPGGKAEEYQGEPAGERSGPETNIVTRSNFMPPEIPRSEQASSFSVQVGSFKNKRNAESLSAKLHKIGYESFVEIPTGAGDKLHRVKVGRFNSRQEAEEMASRLKESGYKVKICGD